MRQIIKFIDDYLEKNSLEWISAVDANRLLDEQGLLGDSSTRKGLPLRNKLRSGEIPHAYQVGVFWRIPSSRTSSKTAKPTTPSQKKSRVTSTVAPCIVHTNSSLEEELTRLTRFKEAMNVSGHDVPDQPGLYCIRLKKSNDLPAAFSQHIGEITNAIVYIGIA